MASKIKITGRPLSVQKEKINSKNIYFVNFLEGGKSKPPKGLPKPSKTSVTVLLNEKQYKKSLFKKSLNNLFLLVEGEIAMKDTIKQITGDIGVICFKIEELNVK